MSRPTFACKPLLKSRRYTSRWGLLSSRLELRRRNGKAIYNGTHIGNKDRRYHKQFYCDDGTAKSILLLKLLA